MKISIIRGAFLNPFEIQNYYPLSGRYKITCFSSKFPISSKVKFPLKKLWSPTDLPLPFKYQILNRLFKDAHYLVGLEKAIKNSDVAHVAETYYHYTLQALSAKRKGLVKKVVSTVWEVIPHNNETLPGRKKIKSVARNEIDHFIAVTEVAKQALIQEGVSPSKITVIPMGVDTKRFRPSKNKRKNPVNILFVGRLVPEKGIGELLQSYSELKKHYPKIKLTLVGSGPLINQCKKAGAIVKQIPYSKIHLEYQAADIFCLPNKPTKTWQEQYGMVLVEALSSGLPIVTSSSPVMQEVCGDSALYSLPGDSMQLTNQLSYLLENKVERNRLSRLSRRRAVKLYDHQKIARQVAKVYAK